MAEHVFSRTTGESSSVGSSPRSDSRPDHRVPALSGPRERTWTALNDSRETYQPSRHGGYRDDRRRPLDTAAHAGWQGTPRRQDKEIPSLPSRPHVGSGGGGGGKNWFTSFRSTKDGENRKETKSHAFDKSLVSRPMAADPAFVRDLKESQRQVYEPILTEMGLAHEMNREPMKLRPIARPETPEAFPAARSEHRGREHGGPLSSNRPMPITAESMAVHDTVADERHARRSRRRPARDGGESILSRLSTTAVVDESDGVVDPRWMPRHIDAMAAGYTGFPDWSSDSSVSAETTDEEQESPRTKNCRKRFGRIFTAADFEELTEFPEPVSFAGGENGDDEKLPAPGFDVVKDEIESSEDSSGSSSDGGVVEEGCTTDDEPSDASDAEVDVDRYNYAVGKDDQGLTGEILSQTRRRPPIVVLPPTPPASPRPLPALPPTPDRLYPVDWKAKFEEERDLLKKEKWSFNRIQEIAVPLMVAFEEIMASSPEFKGAHTAMAFPPIIRKILEERDDAMAEADAYVHRSLGLETQLGNLMAEVRDLRDENRILRVDNERLRNVRGGLPIEAEAAARMAMRRRTTAPLGQF